MRTTQIIIIVLYITLCIGVVIAFDNIPKYYGRTTFAPIIDPIVIELGIYTLFVFLIAYSIGFLTSETEEKKKGAPT